MISVLTGWLKAIMAAAAIVAKPTTLLPTAMSRHLMRARSAATKESAGGRFGWMLTATQSLRPWT